AVDPDKTTNEVNVYRFPGNCQVQYAAGVITSRPESFLIELPKEAALVPSGKTISLPKGARELGPGSSWGMFTIACTIPIAIVMGLIMRIGQRLQVAGRATFLASLLGVVAVLAAVVIGNWVPGSPFERFFLFSKNHTILALALYGFVAAVLPVW